MSENMHEVQVEAWVDPHIHLREKDVRTMKPLLTNVLLGGVDMVGPMPNTEDGLTTAAQVIDYKDFVERLLPYGTKAKVLPILLVTEQTTPKIIDECIAQGIVDCKFLPLLRTTKSHNGIRHYGRLLELGKHCGRVGMKKHFHPEHPSMVFDNRDAEWHFIAIADMFLNETEAQIIWEHGSDARCIHHWEEMAKSGRFSVTLAPQHLLTDENDDHGDVRKTFKPPAKTNGDRQALVELIAKDYSWVRAGSDYAPHDIRTKHVSKGRCSCGAYHGKFALLMYAHALTNLLSTPHGVETFVNFTSRNSRKLHNLPPASRKITLVKKPMVVPLKDEIGPCWTVEYFWADQELGWSLKTMGVS